MKALFAAALTGALLAGQAGLAGVAQGVQPRIEQRVVSFAKGASGATIDGLVKGDQTIDYLVSASAGQTLSVGFAPRNPSAYFNLLAPGNDEALHVGSVAGNRYSGVLTTSGRFVVRVYLMRNASRRNESSRFRLDVGVTGDATKP